jgi:hypothetical protein
MTDASASGDDAAGLAVRLGTHRAPALRQIVVGLDEDAHGMLGEVQVAAHPLADVPAEYRAEARLEAGPEDLTRGWVTAASIEGDEVAIEVRNSVVLVESVIGHLSIAGIDHNEVAWSLSRWMGMAPVVPGLRPFREVIAVAMPITGLDLAAEIDLDPVRVTSDRRLIEIVAANLNDTPEKEAFLAAGAWAVARVEALLLAVAEEAAVPLIGAAIDRVALEVQYSLATDPTGTPLPFARPALLTDPTAVRTALAHGHRSGRTWLRSLDNPPARVPASGPRLALPGVPDEPAWTDALHAWRRAVREADPLTAVGALFEAVEFYASGTKVPRVLTRGELDDVAKAVDAVGLAPEKRSRLEDVLARANEPPLRVRLVAALDADRVPYSAEEIERLWRLRDHRNAALHGRRRTEPDRDDLDLAKGLVNRMLVFRAWRRTSNDPRDERERAAS